MSQRPSLHIVGASARAAAQSAARAGLRPATADLFADVDTHHAADPIRRVAPGEYPEGLLAVVADGPPGPWCYTGALENHPGLVDRIASVRPLWGNPGWILRGVRDPVAVADVLVRAGLPGPGVRYSSRGVPKEGSWLVKPLSSAGGRRIRSWREDSETPVWPAYYQEKIEGPSLAAAFVAKDGRAEFLGISRQLHGGPRGFAYRGSLGPWPLDEEETERIGRMGLAFASAFGLMGLFGVDLIWRDGWPWPVEINPRYTASMEVLERATGRSFLAEHARAFDPVLAKRLRPRRVRPPNGRCIGKAFILAPASCRFPTHPLRNGEGWPRLADLPWPGERFSAGEPVVTVFASGPTLEVCETRLARRVAVWAERLRRNPAD